MTMTNFVRALAISGVGAVSLCAMMVAQKNSVQPQPQDVSEMSGPAKANTEP